MKKTLLVSSFTVAALLLAAPPVRAESAVAPPRCEVRLGIGSNDKVPSNLLAIPVLDSSSPAYTPVLDAPTLTGPSPTAGLTEAPETRGGASRLLVLGGPLANDATYELAYNFGCKEGTTNVPGYASKVKSSFKTQGAIALPTTSGSLSVLPAASSTDTATRLVLKPSAELEAYLPLTLVDVLVDGKVWTTLPYGSLQVNLGSATIRIARQSASAGSASSFGNDLCGAARDGEIKKTFELRPHVAGATTDPTPLSIEATLDCKLIATPSNDAGPDDLGNGLPANNQANNQADDGGDGCQVGPSNMESSAIPLAGFGLAFVISATRRRALKKR